MTEFEDHGGGSVLVDGWTQSCVAKHTLTPLRFSVDGVKTVSCLQ
jgi:hypothetical protein